MAPTPPRVVVIGVAVLFAVVLGIWRSRGIVDGTATDTSIGYDGHGVAVASVPGAGALRRYSVERVVDGTATSFDKLMDEIVASFGRVGQCLYAPGALLAAAEEESALLVDKGGGRMIVADDVKRKYLRAERLGWSLQRRPMPPPMPETFRTQADQLRMLKLLLSIALDRIVNSAELRSEYESLLTLLSSNRSTPAVAANVVASFERSVGHAVFGIMAYAHTVLQMIHDMEKKGDTDPEAIVQALCDTKLEYEGTSITKSRTNANGFAWLKRRAVVLRLDRNNRRFDAQTPINARFWNSLRPTLGCSNLVRLCERPDGCRNTCNADYMLHRMQLASSTSTTLAAALDGTASHAWTAVPIDMVGFGSNNEFDWEESVVSTHAAAVARWGADKVNPLRAIVTFDCTIKEVQPTDTVKSIPGGFGFGKLCLDKEPSDGSITMGELLGLLTTNTRKSPSGDTRALEWFGKRGRPKQGGASPLGRRLSILKLDVEGYEFGSMPHWLREDVASIHNRRAASLGAPVADQLQMEFHRMGHKTNRATSTPGALQAHLWLLHTYALGFIPVAQERNHADNCCYEFTFVASGFFVMSEAWLVASSNPRA